MQQKYQVLRAISLLYRIIGVIGIIGGVIALIVSLSTKGSDPITGILALMGSAVGAVILFGLGELFQLFIDMEENTRRATALLQQSLKR